MTKRQHAGHDFATTAVPPEKRRSFVWIALAIMGGPICVASLFAGASLSGGLALSQTLLAVLIGGVLLVVYGGTLGAIGARSGYSTGVLLRQSFGSYGSRIVSALLALCLVGWYAVQTSLFGDVMHTMLPEGGWLTTPSVAAAWGGLLMLTTACIGFRGLAWLSLVAVPLLLGLSVWGVSRAIGNTDVLAFVPAEQGSLGAAITLVVGTLAIGTTVAADMSRYAKSTSESWLAIIIGYLGTNTFMLMSGAVLAVATGSGDLIASMAALGLGIPAFLVLVLGQWTTNDNNLYSASLGVTGAMPWLHKPYVVLVLGVIATVCAAAGVANNFVGWLILLGVMIPPIGGVIIADHLIVAKRFGERGEFSFSLPAFASWVIGSASGWFIPYGVQAINSIVVGFVVYLALALFCRKQAVVQATPSQAAGQS